MTHFFRLRRLKHLPHEMELMYRFLHSRGSGGPDHVQVIHSQLSLNSFDFLPVGLRIIYLDLKIRAPVRAFDVRGVVRDDPGDPLLGNDPETAVLLQSDGHGVSNEHICFVVQTGEHGNGFPLWFEVLLYEVEGAEGAGSQEQG